MTNYAQKLKDPRWQKKRLRILERDKYTCQLCKSKEKFLHVHHKIYNDKDPWDIEDGSLITLCSECHECEQLDVAEHGKLLLQTLKSKFLSEDLLDLSSAFNDMPIVADRRTQTKILCIMLRNKKLFETILNLVKRNG